MCQPAPGPNCPEHTEDESPASMPADMPVRWLAELAGLPVPAEDAEPLADALQLLSQFVKPLIAQAEPGACMTGDFDPRWR